MPQNKTLTDFGLEMRLKELDPSLHRRFTDMVFVMQHTLSRFRLLFPEFTDHSVFHSLDVLDFCNTIVGPEQLLKLNADEIYILLMCCYLHDIGMCITRKDYAEFKNALKEGPGEDEYFSLHPGDSMADFVRDQHHEFSGRFITKYAELLEIPSEEMLFAIVQVARGHRRTDLFNEEEYPVAYDLKDGNTACLPYLAALLRLADEVDVVADRNPRLLYDIESLTSETSIVFNRILQAVPSMDTTSEGFLMHVDTDDETLFAAIEKMAGKMQATLDLCRAAVSERTSFTISQQWVRILR